MSTSLHTRKLYASDIVRVAEVRCRPHDGACGAEEFNRFDSVCVPRCGVFVKHVGRVETVGDANHTLFFRAGETYRVSHPVLCGDDCLTLDFAHAVLRETVASFDAAVSESAESVFAFGDGPASGSIALTAQKLRQHLHSSAVDRLAVDEAGVLLLGAALSGAYAVRGVRTARRLETEAARRAAVHTACEYLGAHLADPVGLSEVARVTHTSRFHMARLFRTATGLSLHEYQRRLRLAAALERLADAPPDLTGLALELGYASHSHFSTAFRAAFGLTPSTFRRDASAAALREISTRLQAARPD